MASDAALAASSAAVAAAPPSLDRWALWNAFSKAASVARAARWHSLSASGLYAMAFADTSRTSAANAIGLAYAPAESLELIVP